MNKSNVTRCSHVISNLEDIWHVCSSFSLEQLVTSHRIRVPLSGSGVEDSRRAPSALHTLRYWAARSRFIILVSRMRETHPLGAHYHTRSARMKEMLLLSPEWDPREVAEDRRTSGLSRRERPVTKAEGSDGTFPRASERLPGLVGDADEQRNDDGTLWKEGTLHLRWLSRGPRFPAAQCDGSR